MLLMLLLAACTASGNGELTITNVQANLTLPTETGSVWLEISNGTSEDEALTGAVIDGCGVIELHDMVMEDDVMMMQAVEGGQIPIPAGETVELKRGGLHMMCFDKTGSFAEGDEVGITLEFANAGAVEATGVVVAPGGPGGMDMNHDDH